LSRNVRSGLEGRLLSLLQKKRGKFAGVLPTFRRGRTAVFYLRDDPDKVKKQFVGLSYGKGPNYSAKKGGGGEISPPLR